MAGFKQNDLQEDSPPPPQREAFNDCHVTAVNLLRDDSVTWCATPGSDRVFVEVLIFKETERKSGLVFLIGTSLSTQHTIRLTIHQDREPEAEGEPGRSVKGVCHFSVA